MATIDKINVNGVTNDIKDSGAVRFDGAQTLTDAQKTTARGNIAAASAGEVQTIENEIGSTVLPTTAQTLTGAIAEHESDIADLESAGNVRFDEAQSLTLAQKQQARDNIGAASEDQVDAKANKTTTVNGHPLSANVTVTKGDVGLGNVNNTSDMNKPVSTAQQAALDDKADVIVDTASGAIASFPDGAAAPAKDITIDIEPVQSGSGDPSPDNVRPISGWTGANVYRTGKNLLNPSNLEIFNSYHYIHSLNRIPVEKNTTYTISFSNSVGDGKVYLYDSDGNQIDIESIGTMRAISFTTTSNTATISFYNAISFDSVVTIESAQVQLEFGSTATDYVPYTGNTYLISWQSVAGTVYGGTLDVTTGVLTVTTASRTFNGSETWTMFNGVFYYPLHELKKLNGYSYAIRCDILKTYPAHYSLTTDNYGISGYDDYVDRYPNQNWIYVSVPGVTTADELKAWLANNPIHVTYELATPQTYQLTPTEVEMLLGENNVWADTGDSTVAYRADTKLYIQKINAPTDDDMIADAQIASGKYFIVGGNLYKSTTTIPAGDTITPGTNCILTNLADALNALNA